MPKRTDLKRILVIGAGPIVIGQACEFDYSGTQACRALLQEGYEVILINSNPATIMTDPEMATRTYVEPLTVSVVTSIIARERPDAILPTMGGQTALNIAIQLFEEGILDRYGVQLIGANVDAIRVSEDREAFKQMLVHEGLETLRSRIVGNLEEAWQVARQLGFPLVLRPSFTLGGSGGAVVFSESGLEAAVQHGLALSPVRQILMEESALGWKEYEFEVMRDCRDNVVIVCSVENVDPMGVHTGDSITVAPTQTLSDKEYHYLRNASIRIIRAVGVDAGGCNIQFAIHPQSGRVVVIEMNPRVSRSSALVSKATGVPIAKISARLAVGYSLDEIPNEITGTTLACFEPAIDYVVTKVPRFSFEKFPGADNSLSPQMKSVGEVMAIGATFQESFQKALRGLEIGLNGFSFPLEKIEPDVLLSKLARPTADRLRWIHLALATGMSPQEISGITGLDLWFLENMQELVRIEQELAQAGSQLSPKLLQLAKRKGFSDRQLAELLSLSEQDFRQMRLRASIMPVFKSVDTCAGEFEAITPYFYSTYDGCENEAPTATESGRTVLIIGGGPNRIGQGIEFDYCCVHAAKTLQELGYEAVMVNSNPETVSTDYDISDRLYFEPLTPEDLLNITSQEKPLGVITQLGGQTPLKLSHALQDADVRILGTSTRSIDLAEDRDKFGQLLMELGLKAPESGIARTESEAREVAGQIGFPLIVRPSYVLGGQGMRIFYSEENFLEYISTMIRIEPDYPVLIERFLENALEVDVDAVSDGKDVFIGGVLEHIEHAGIHSGDSSCVLPAQSIPQKLLSQIEESTRRLAVALDVRGLLNIQFAIKNEAIYVLEVNPRASRTVPFVCKATGLPLIRMAVEIMLGRPLAELEYPAPKTALVAVKAPVFPYIKFRESDPVGGPEMRSTGEVMGIDTNFPMAYAKALIGAGHVLPTEGEVFISVNDQDKSRVLEIAQAYASLGFSLVATAGTAKFLSRHGLTAGVIHKKHEGSPNAEELIGQGRIRLVINTPAGESALNDDSYIRKAAIRHHVPMATTLSCALAMAKAIGAIQDTDIEIYNLQSLT